METNEDPDFYSIDLPGVPCNMTGIDLAVIRGQLSDIFKRMDDDVTEYPLNQGCILQIVRQRFLKKEYACLMGSTAAVILSE